MLSPASETNTIDHINAGRRPPASRDARRRGSRRDHMMNRRDVFCENRRRASACCARERAMNGREWNGDGVRCGASSKAAVSGCIACSGSPWTRAARGETGRLRNGKKEGGRSAPEALQQLQVRYFRVPLCARHKQSDQPSNDARPKNKPSWTHSRP